MSPNILLNVKKNLLKVSIINEKRIDILIDNMKSWYIGKIIYPSQVKSMLLINYSEVYGILEIIKDLGIIKYNYEVYCNKCEKFVETPILDSLNQFPKNLYCDDGRHKLNPINDVILIFKVIRDE